MTCIDFAGTLILRSSGASPTAAPSDGAEYTPGEIIAGCQGVYTGETSSFTDSNLTDNTVYYYRAFSFDDPFNYSERTSSIPEEIAPRDRLPPDKVAGFKAIGGEGKIILSWNNPEDDWKGTRVLRKENTFPEAKSGASFVSVRMRCPSLSFPSATPEKKWQMISVPGKLQSSSACSFVEDNLGPPDTEVWKLYRWNPQNKE